jgi:hypothetical protein
MVPPEELMPRSHVKRSGDWLRKKLKGTDRAQQFETVEAGKVLSQKTEGSSDREIEQFLSGYLSQPGGKSRKRPFPRSRKRAK